MRLACYNVENLFDRAKALNLDTWADGKPVLEDFSELGQLLGEIDYTSVRKARMDELMLRLGLEKSDTGPFVILRRNRGGLLKRPRAGGIEITAAGRAEWVGQIELREEPVNEHAMRNTARVMNDVEADILAVVEAESRPALAAFNDEILVAVGGKPFRQVMVIDGNDERGIDVGLMTRAGHEIGLMRSHVDDMKGAVRIFSRDCPEFRVTLPSGKTVFVLVNHLKSKGYGSVASSNRRRKLQAERVRDIYNELLAEGHDLVAVVGDLNDTPGSAPLKPLLDGTDLKDVFEHPKFDDGGFPGTYGSCTKSNKIDYILLSPKLFENVTAGSVFRKGMWPGVRPRKWESYDELTKPHEAGSDHAAVWVDIDI